MRYVLFLVLVLIGFAFANSKITNINPFLLQTYGKMDLATKPVFQGGYINFGYWKGIFPKKGPITKAERIKASEALYDLVIRYLNIQPTDKIAEIGSGHGNGCVKIAKNFKAVTITGVDIMPEQIERSKTEHQHVLNQFPTLSFSVGSSDSLPFSDNSLTKIFSVEAAQCFPSMEEFAREAWRVLQSGGRLVITAHFATNEDGFQAMRELIPTIDQGVDLLIPIQNVRDTFVRNGFREVSFESIGGNVFEGFKHWQEKVEDVKWGSNISIAYKNNYMDYYLIVLEKESNKV